MQRKFRFFLLTILILTLLSSSIPAFASENTIDENESFIKTQDVSNDQITNLIHAQSKLECKVEQADNISVENDLFVNSSKGVKNIETEIGKRSNVLLPDNPRTIVNGVLTEDNDVDFHFFSVTSNKFMVAQLISDNADYCTVLYMVDYDTGTATPTNISGNSGDIIALNGLPKGGYAFAVFSNDNVGDTYSLKINATNPSGDITDILKITPSLQQFVILYSNNDVYANGTFVYNASPNASTKHLDWKREYYFPYDGNYKQRTHDISDVKIKAIAGPYEYTSSYASSDNVMLIYLDEGTLFTYFESEFHSNPHYYSSFNDILGKTTPRRLEADDYSYGEHILIYDLNTGTPIDFFSVLNFYCSAGVEDLPVLTPLND